jgi:hypothetical protein
LDCRAEARGSDYKGEKKALKDAFFSSFAFLPLPIEIGVITRLILAPKFYKKIAGSRTKPFGEIRGKTGVLAHFKRRRRLFLAGFGKRSGFASSIGEFDEGLLRRQKGILIHEKRHRF